MSYLTLKVFLKQYNLFALLKILLIYNSMKRNVDNQFFYSILYPHILFHNNHYNEVFSKIILKLIQDYLKN